MTDKTLLLGLIGHGSAQSRTPGMHEAEGLAQGIPTVYRVIDTAEEPAKSWALKDILDAARTLGFNGLNITHPHKQEVLEFLDEVDERAAKIGAVNTVVIRDGKFYGYNTDVTGFGRGLEQGLPEAKLDNVVQVGAGGAGNAVAQSLIAAGVKNLFVADLDPKRAQTLAETVKAAASEDVDSFTITGVDMADVEGYITKADGVVNATPVGMEALPGTAFDTSILKPTQWVSDVIYLPLETQLLREAKAIGCPVVDGSGMAVGQALDAFKHFTGREADTGRLRETFVAQGQ
ncbi:shikimate dehydrogenase-like protein [Corynebacterium casei UCMA 3821]|uniref:Shikimate dehydrogenase (NADP(+)) n=1 Tax=Corynebacterium casei UCMA 3821 TaxID=1110505 RepID=G7HUH1_9CORY|nr:shikimate dehydrogenase [Corynebacterium casei]CCE53927.1 shikimate dehydrogenase-like protein [Corynebacterium casei UCMA 3821]